MHSRVASSVVLRASANTHSTSTHLVMLGLMLSCGYDYRLLINLLLLITRQHILTIYHSHYFCPFPISLKCLITRKVEVV